MKYLIILGDGMADVPQEILGGKTPLQAANTPNIDALCKKSRTGKLITVPKHMPPGSEIANMAVLGYDVEKVYEGRGVLEAASMGVDIEEGDLAMRCNILTIEDEKIKNHSAGHISTEEATELVQFLNDNLGIENAHFYPGVSYRHLLVVKGGKKETELVPPHDVPGTPVVEVLPKPIGGTPNETADLLNKIITDSRTLLENHPINKKRKAEGKEPANAAWMWSAGYKPAMETLSELYGIESGAVISAVDLIQGIGKYAGLDIIKVEGATGLYDTNYEGKVEAAMDALKSSQFVYLHIEASDEAGHEGDVELKTKTIEYLDQRVVKYVVENMDKLDEPLCIAILPDHPTPCDIRTHTHEPVPFMIFSPKHNADKVETYDEFDTDNGAYGILSGSDFIKAFLNKE